MSDVEKKEQVEIKGAFLESLHRNNTKIKADRASAIGEDTAFLYKRGIEDIQIQLRQLRRQQENALDLSPENALNLKPAADFNSKAYVDDDITIQGEVKQKINATKTIILETKIFNDSKECLVDGIAKVTVQGDE